MLKREALRKRIELYESRKHGAPVKVINLRMGARHALADLMVHGERLCDRRYFYNDFFLARQLRGA